jgi:hypothetical protein
VTYTGASNLADFDRASHFERPSILSFLPFRGKHPAPIFSIDMSDATAFTT